MGEYIDEPGILRSTRSDGLLIDGESKVARAAITPPIGDDEDGTTVEAHTPASGDAELSGLDIGGTDYEIVDQGGRDRLHAVEQRVHPIRQEPQTWEDITDGSAGWSDPASLITTVNNAAALTYDNAPKSGTDDEFVYVRIPIGARQSEYRFQLTVGGGQQDGETFNHVLGTWPTTRIGADSSWQYFQIGFYQGDTFSAAKLQRGTGDFTWEGGVTKAAVYEQVKGIIVGGVTDDDESETIDVGGTSASPQRPARPTHVRSVWGNDGVTDGTQADELALVEVASRDERVSHAAYDYQYSSNQVSLRENDIALTGWHSVSASYDAANPGLVWDSDNNVFVSNAVEFTTTSDRRIRVSLDLGLVGYLESGDTLSLAVTTTGNLKAIPAHAGNDHAAVAAFFFSFDSSVHDRHTHVQFDIVFTAPPAATDTVALAITNNIIASRATASPVVVFSVPQIDHIPTQAYRGHVIGDRLTGGYWEHYRREWPRQLRSPGQSESATIADRQTAALVSHVDESPYLVATADVRAVVLTVRALGTGFNVSGDPVYVNVWTDIPGVMDPVRLGRTEINARDFETNGVAGAAYGVRAGQRFFVTQGTGSTLGYDIEVTWDANLVASRPAVTVLQTGIAWFGTQAQYDAITTKDPSRLYLVRADP